MTIDHLAWTGAVLVVSAGLAMWVLAIREWRRARRPATVEPDMATVIVSPECKPLAVTPHSLMVDGWRETLERHEWQAEEIRDELIEIRQAELRGEAFSDTRQELRREHDEAQRAIADIRAQLETEGSSER